MSEISIFNQYETTLGTDRESDAHDPDQKPKSSPKTTTPAKFDIANIVNANPDDINRQGRSKLYVPNLSAKKLGNKRPRALPAFKSAN